MAMVNQVNEVMHRIRVKLYPSYLPKVQGAYLARTNNEASLNIEEVCAALKNRGGFTGSYKELIENVRQFFDEVAYQLCDGYAINTGYFSIHPNVGGTFNSLSEGHNPDKHPIGFRFRPLVPLRRLAKDIVIDIEGLADASGYIDEFVDIDENSTNAIFVPGDQFSISGHKIKIAGDENTCGLFFVPVEDPTKAVKVMRIADNSPSKIIGIAPDTQFLYNKLEIRTQFSGSGSVTLKNTRIITSSFVLEAA